MRVRVRVRVRVRASEQRPWKTFALMPSRSAHGSSSSW